MAIFRQRGNSYTGSRFRRFSALAGFLIALSGASFFVDAPSAVAQDYIRRDPYGNPLPPEEQPRKIQGGAQSTTLQSGTNSTTLQTGTNSTTLQTGTNSTLLETGTKSTLLNLGTNATKLETGTAGTLLQTGIERKIEPQNVLVLLDCSSTMKLSFDGSQNAPDERLIAAKAALKHILQSTPPDVRIGLRVFGNRQYRNDGMDCNQSFLLEPIGLHNRGEMMAKAEILKASGLTPLEYALRQAPSDFEGLEGTRHIILISDGADTCKKDPCATIRKLRELGFKMRVDVIGVDKKAKAAEGWQLQCIAQESGGKYFEAETAAKMADAVGQSMLEAISRNAADQKVAGQVVPKPQALQASPAAALDVPGTKKANSESSQKSSAKSKQK
ncbi:MAG: VWA domain-containing protein [Cyanobacteria bacterium SZAS LIN-5]|nr:VWA domain-containing protein [Cyanobacteria bacterium SZAS LIN-5]